MAVWLAFFFERVDIRDGKCCYTNMLGQKSCSFALNDALGCTAVFSVLAPLHVKLVVSGPECEFSFSQLIGSWKSLFELLNTPRGGA